MPFRKWLLISKNLNTKMLSFVYQFTENRVKNGPNLQNGPLTEMSTLTIYAGLFKFHVYSKILTTRNSTFKAHEI